MSEITLADLIAWDPRLRPALPDGGHTHERLDDPFAGLWAERELSWAVTVRASAPMLPTLRGGELVLIPGRVLAETEVDLPTLLRELAGLGASGVVLDAWPVQPAPLPVLIANPITLDLENEINRLLTERRGEFYRAGTELGRLLTAATSANADLGDVLATAAAFLEVPAAVVDERGNVVATTTPAAIPPAGATPPGNRGWRDDRFGLRLASGETLWLGPVPKAQRALIRLAGERITVAAEAAIARAADARPRGPARALAVNALLSGTAGDPTRAAVILGLPTNGIYRVALGAPVIDHGAFLRTLVPLGTVHESGMIDGAAAALVELRPEAHGGSRGIAQRRREPTVPRLVPPAWGWLALSGPAQGTAMLSAAAREARYVAALLTAGLIPGPVARFDVLTDLGVYRLLYRFWGSPELASFAAEALGELTTRDRRGTLRRSLLAYLAEGGSHGAAAARLGIHRNTLSYRLKQIAALTGREPTDPGTHLVLHLALLAAALPPAPEASPG